MKTYEPFDLMDVARRGMNYLVSMVDERQDFLPYWYVQINQAPAYARHVRVDDAELVASWYEAVAALEKILGPDARSTAVKAGFKKHLLRSFGPKGLRYSEPYPWTHSINATFHEQGWVLAGLNRLLQDEPGCDEAERAAAGMVRGMRELVHDKKTLTFWSGDRPVSKPTFEFPGDVYMKDGGWVPERLTGRGDLPVRNNVVIEPLATRARLFDDKIALDLAVGLANHLLSYARYFTYDMQYHGHVHSTVWCAIGLLRLGRMLHDETLIEKAVGIFEFTRSRSSSFGWVPEYIGWHPDTEEHCETCCIKDMIEFALEAADLGYDYWPLVDAFTRNQLAEQQIKDGSFIAVDPSAQDTDDMTWRDIDKRAVGGWSGGALPNSISVARFRSIAGCCVGTAPVGLWLVWSRIVEKRDGCVYVNLPMAKDDALAQVEIGYPNTGMLRVKARQAGRYRIRHYPWMGDRVETRLNGQTLATGWADGCFAFDDVQAGDILELAHPLRTETRHETVCGTDFRVTWKGGDVVELAPPGLPVRLYQRTVGVPKDYPRPATGAAKVDMGPTQQK